MLNVIFLKFWKTRFQDKIVLISVLFYSSKISKIEIFFDFWFFSFNWLFISASIDMLFDISRKLFIHCKSKIKLKHSIPILMQNFRELLSHLIPLRHEMSSIGRIIWDSKALLYPRIIFLPLNSTTYYAIQFDFN